MITESLNGIGRQTKTAEFLQSSSTHPSSERVSNLVDKDSRETESSSKEPKSSRSNAKRAAVIGAVVLVAIAASWHFAGSKAPSAPEAQPTSVAVSAPIHRDVASQLQALGQFSAVERVELRAQVGGTLTQIGFKDGDIVKKGDLLFVIDPTPYEIKLSQATALRESAKARFDLAERQLKRARTLIVTGAGTVENTDQRVAEEQAAQAAVDDAEAQVRDAQFDLDHTRITAPFSGRIGSHQVSIGNLIAGSRAATSPTTLLTTIVSLNPIYLDFDMSESDYASFQQERSKQNGPLADKVSIALSGDAAFGRLGTLDFIDNALNRSSGTIHARATVANDDLQLTPGAFGRVKVAISAPSAALMVPDAAVIQDQSQHMVYTIGEGNVVTAKIVEVGELQNGLRVIRSGLASNDQVIIDSIPRIHAGAKVTPETKPITVEKIDTSEVASQKTVAANAL